MKLLEEVIALVKAVRGEKSAANIEDLLSWQRRILPLLTMARVRQIADNQGGIVEEDEWTQLKFIVEEWAAKLRRN